jgi:hypothetical protein
VGLLSSCSPPLAHRSQYCCWLFPTARSEQTEPKPLLGSRSACFAEWRRAAAAAVPFRRTQRRHSAPVQSAGAALSRSPLLHPPSVDCTLLPSRSLGWVGGTKNSPSLTLSTYEIYLSIRPGANPSCVGMSSHRKPAFTASSEFEPQAHRSAHGPSSGPPPALATHTCTPSPPSRFRHLAPPLLRLLSLRSIPQTTINGCRSRSYVPCVSLGQVPASGNGSPHPTPPP